MDNKEHIDFEELLIRYLQGTADSQSLQQLLEVVRKSEDKKNELARLKAIYDSLSVQVDALKYPIDASWEKMRQKIDSEIPATKPKGPTIRNITTLWSYAAVFLLAVLLAGQYFYYQNKSLRAVPQDSYTRFVVEKGSGKSSLFLPDGTKVLLNAGTTIQYPTRFDQKERTVMLEGEGYFEVAKNREKPFIVTVNGVDIRVLGTSFNVSAYQEEVVTTLVEGKVQLKRGDEQVVLSPNQQAIWSDDKFKVKQVDARNYVLWKEGIFYFEDVDLERILDDMARWYNVNIFYMNSTLKKMKFSVEIKRYEDINEILRRIEQTKRVKFEIKDRTINVYE